MDVRSLLMAVIDVVALLALLTAGNEEHQQKAQAASSLYSRRRRQMDCGAFGTVLTLSFLFITTILAVTPLLILSTSSFPPKIDPRLRGLRTLALLLEISEPIYVKPTPLLRSKIYIIGSRTRSERPAEAKARHQLSFNSLIRRDSGLNFNLIRILGSRLLFLPIQALLPTYKSTQMSFLTAPIRLMNTRCRFLILLG